MLTCKGNGGSPVVVGNGRFLPFRSPGGFYGIWKHPECRNRLKAVTTRREITATNEVEPGVIKIVAVEIADENSCGAGAHEAIQRLIKESSRGCNTDLVREIAADGATTCGGIIRFSDAGKQEKARVAESPRSEEDDRGGLEDFFARWIH